jgi:hypothetical protein
MFSHTIHNLNHFDIEKTDFYAIPFGHRCTSALACKFSGLRHFSLPFDWLEFNYPHKIKKAIENDFIDFIPDVNNNNYYNKYDMYFKHFNSNKCVGILEHERRVERFNQILKEKKKKYFVYINEDYLFDQHSRSDEFNDSMLKSMLEIEKLLKEKNENLDYNILYFNFRKETIPYDSNIINIVLTSDSFYNDLDPNSPYEDLRKYCGSILKELFDVKSAFNFTYDCGVFND